MEYNNIILIGLDDEYTNQVGSQLASMLDLYFLDSLSFYKFDISPLTISNIIKQNSLDYFLTDYKKKVKYVSSFENTVITVSNLVLDDDKIMNYLSNCGIFIGLWFKSKLLRNIKSNNECEVTSNFDSNLKLKKENLKKYCKFSVSLEELSEIKTASQIIRLIKTD